MRIGPARIDVDQVLYALERARRALNDQADRMFAEHDYGAEAPAEDAERMDEAIALLTGLKLQATTTARDRWRKAWSHARADPSGLHFGIRNLPDPEFIRAGRNILRERRMFDRPSRETPRDRLERRRAWANGDMPF